MTTKTIITPVVTRTRTVEQRIEKVSASANITQMGLEHGHEGGGEEIVAVKVHCDLFTSSCILKLPVRFGGRIALDDELKITIEVLEPEPDE